MSVSRYDVPRDAVDPFTERRDSGRDRVNVVRIALRDEVKHAAICAMNPDMAEIYDDWLTEDEANCCGGRCEARAGGGHARDQRAVRAGGAQRGE